MFILALRLSDGVKWKYVLRGHNIDYEVKIGSKEQKYDIYLKYTFSKEKKKHEIIWIQVKKNRE